MKKFLKILLFLFAILTGGLLGYFLLADNETIKLIIFIISCMFLGQIFYTINKLIDKKIK